MTLTHYPNFNLDFQYFIKESRVEDITWVFCIYEIIKLTNMAVKSQKLVLKTQI